MESKSVSGSNLPQCEVALRLEVVLLPQFAEGHFEAIMSPSNSSKESRHMPKSIGQGSSVVNICIL